MDTSFLKTRASSLTSGKSTMTRKFDTFSRAILFEKWHSYGIVMARLEFRYDVIRICHQICTLRLHILTHEAATPA